MKTLPDDATKTEPEEETWFRDYAVGVRSEPRIDPVESAPDFLEVAQLLAAPSAPKPRSRG